MRGFTIHAVVFAVVNALLVAAWLATTGSSNILSSASGDPIGAFRDGMWPVAVIAVWGGGLVIHGAVVLTAAPRKLRRRIARQARAAHGHHDSRHGPSRRPGAASPASGAAGAAGPVGPAMGDLGHHVTRAAVDFMESLANRTNRPRPTEPGRQLVTVMFTDLVGSTDLTEQLGDATWHRILGEHRVLVRECVKAQHGTEVGTQGDGFLVRFASPDPAVACAVEIQRRMLANRDAGAFTPEVRVGIHAGEAMADDNDLVGRVINLASRVTTAADPSQILVTEPVADHMSPGILLVDRGLVALKGISQARHLFQVDWRPAVTDRPTPEPTTEPEQTDPLTS